MIRRTIRNLLLPGLTILLQALASLTIADENLAFFEREIRPILVKRCESCHSAAKSKTKGGLALDSAEGWKKGGEHGQAIVPGDPSASLLIQAITYKNEELQMPPEENGGPMPAIEIAKLTEWVRRGAIDPRTVVMATRGGLTENEIKNWWSFQPLRGEVAEEPLYQIIDQLINAKLISAGLRPTPFTDRRSLIRRATYDLTGLPPSVADVVAFEKDQSAEAWPRLIDRLLARKQYGERWGRHWLDLVRYADTAGENTDHPIPEAWRYRNWVIEAFNRNLPYDKFVREQIAGDLIHREDNHHNYANGVVATGFLAVARRFDHDSDKHMHLTHEDAIDTIGKAFLGLSIACARCHDHKYDPITSKDYYALYGILENSRFSFPGCEAKQRPRDQVPMLPPETWAKTIVPWQESMNQATAEIKTIDEAITRQTTAFADQAKGVRKIAEGKIADGGSNELAIAGGTQKLQLKKGELLVLTINHDGNYGADTTMIDWRLREAGGASREWRTSDLISDFASSNPHLDQSSKQADWLYFDARKGLSLLPEQADQISGNKALKAWRKGDNPAVFVNCSDIAVKVWTTLAPRSVFVHPAQDGPVALGWISPSDGEYLLSGNVVDAHPGGPNGVTWQIDQYPSDFRALIQPMLELLAKRRTASQKQYDLLGRSPIQPMAYGVVDAEKPVVTKLHLRGDPEKLGEVVPRRWLEVFGGSKVTAQSGSGRKELAIWLTDPTNPLVSRVIVNRIWQHHFGQGLVPTPSDFGTRGLKPANPELLDYLALWFIRSGWDIKALHRQIMLSAAYQRSSDSTNSPDFPKNHEIDPTNSLNWRFDRRRLSAEELRDSLLLASGRLDLSAGGPHPIPDSSTWSYTQHVPFAGVPETNLRSVYQMTLRNRRMPFMALFDGADPNATTAMRQVTTVPTQSLFFLNDPFFHTQAAVLAERILQLPDQVARMQYLYQTALQRWPTPEEIARANSFREQYEKIVEALPATDRDFAKWSALCRVVLASNEFLYVD